MLQAITKEGNALLMAIRGSESSTDVSGYNMRYSPKGGATFADFSKHPAIYENVPWRTDGKKSDAAGAYEFLSSTWKPLAAKFGLPDFSPASQDKGAWLLAQRDYAAKTGGDLQTALEQGNLSGVTNALSSTWTSLPSGSEKNKATSGFFDKYFSFLKSPAVEKANTVNCRDSGLMWSFGRKTCEWMNENVYGNEVLDKGQEDKTLLEAASEDLSFQRIVVGITGLLLLTVGFIKLKA